MIELKEKVITQYATPPLHIPELPIGTITALVTVLAVAIVYSGK